MRKRPGRPRLERLGLAPPLTIVQHYDDASGEKNTSYNGVTNYNNFYEFSTTKVIRPQTRTL